jgi:hypothetical protein
MQLNAFYDEFLPAVAAHFAKVDKAVPSVLKFEFPREDVFDVLENYMDASNLPVGESHQARPTSGSSGSLLFGSVVLIAAGRSLPGQAGRRGAGEGQPTRRQPH